MVSNEVILIGTFVAVALLVAGPYWLLIGRHEASTQATLQQRVRVSEPRPAATVAGLENLEQLSSIPALNVALLRVGGLSAALNRKIHQAGLKISVGALLLASGICGLGAQLLITRLGGIVLAGVVAGLLALTIPFWVLRFLAARRLHQFEAQFPEAVDLIARTLRAGHAFTTGLRIASEELAQPVGGEFKILYDQQNYGLPITEALRALATRVPIIDAQFFVTAVLTQREAGGNLAEVLDNLSAVIRERFKVKRQLRVISAHGRLTGWVLTFMPLGLAVMLHLKTPDHFQVLYQDPLGVKMIIAAICLQLIGGFAINKLTNIDY